MNARASRYTLASLVWSAALVGILSGFPRSAPAGSIQPHEIPDPSYEPARFLETLQAEGAFGQHVSAARESLARQDLVQAIWELRKAAATAPHPAASAAVQTSLGMLYNGTGEHAQALEIARGALELAPTNAQAHDVLATAHLGLGERQKAIAAYKRVVAHAPESAVGHLHLGDAFLANGQFEQALASYGQALEHDPDRLAALLKSATVLQTSGKHAEAVARAQRAVTLRPEHALSHAILGDVWASQGDFERAEAEYRQALRLDPSLRGVYDSLAELYARTNRRDRAIEAYRALLARDPGQVAAHAALAKLYEAAEQLALRDYHLGVAAAAAEKTDAATRHYGAALEQDPTSVAATVALASVHLRRGDTRSAAALAHRLLAQGGGDATARTLLGQVRLAEKKPSEAELEFRKAIDADATYLPAWIHLGTLLRAAGRCEEAVPILRRTLELSPGRGAAHRDLGDCHQFLEAWEPAVQAYQQALRLNPLDARALNGLAWSHATTGRNLEEAVFLAGRAARLHPNDGGMLDTLGWTQFLTGNYDEAAQRLRAAAELLPEEPTIRYHLARTHQARGELDQAREQLARAVSLNPGFPEAEDARRILREIENGS